MRRSARTRNKSTEFAQAQLGQIPLVALRHAVVVGDVLNFRHAANVLGVTQSSVSARIKALEEALGIVLFERRHRGVRLTEAGRRFIAEVSAGIDHLDYAVRTAGAVSNGGEGRLAIGLHTSIAFGFLADLRSRFRAAYPKVEQAIMEGRSSETIALVRDGKLDVAFVVGAVEAPDCHSRELWQEPLVIALPAEHPLVSSLAITWADLAPETFLVRDGGSGPQVFDHVVHRVVERARSPHIHRFDVGRDTLMHMVAAGDGITLTSEATTHVQFPGVVFRSIADETKQAQFSAVWSPHNRSPALRNMLDLAIQMSRSARSV
ncbi:LysR substrate-binding domain-containing protein [Sphingobium sp. BYY-5]|uniref:LysR substrate-binding domain-containing protein n=1 Tax=Sphingobium sp. BYY-5 TaxID=2926400 RepID=UPI001FA6AE9F|nr:LysR substrate-binding domain-containing protein [Sphingobium sp. BYY-5]MCI4591197.1 LysR substrate-binding domain-containing protein [Sphingobium sp. BYY-5]